jgi:hypothetical protein
MVTLPCLLDLLLLILVHAHTSVLCMILTLFIITIIIIIIIVVVVVVVIVVSCHRFSLPGISLKPAVISPTQASSVRLQYFPYCM